MMDSYTFGNSKAAVNLMTILEEPENARYSRRVASILSKYFQSMASIMFIPDKTTREAVLILWRHKFLDRLNNTDCPEIVKTHAACVIVSLYRQYKDNGKKAQNAENPN